MILFILILAIILLFLFSGEKKVVEQTVLGTASPAVPDPVYTTDINSNIARSAKSTFLASRDINTSVLEAPVPEVSILGASTPIITPPVEKEPEVVNEPAPVRTKDIFRPVTAPSVFLGTGTNRNLS